MNNDKDIHDLFQAAKPELSSSDDFLAKLNTRLDEIDALETVMEYKRAAERRYKRAIAAAFGFGIVAGAAIVLSTLFSPTPNLAPMLQNLGISSEELGSTIESARTVLPQIRTYIIAAIPLLAIAAGLLTFNRLQE